MPRIRTLKPEHKQHRRVGALTHRQYRLWIGMLTEADDEGRIVADARQLRATVFPYHPEVKVPHVAGDLETIAAVGLIRLYHVRDTLYADLPSWRKHQRLDRAHFTPSRHPRYEDRDVSQRKLSESMTSSLLGDSHESTRSQGREGTGRDGTGREPRDTAAPGAPLDSLEVGAAAPNGTAAPPGFTLPATVARALDRMPMLGPQLRDPAWWQSELRAHPTLDLATEALRAEAWCRSNPGRAPRRQIRRFLHAWFLRAEEPR